MEKYIDYLVTWIKKIVSDANLNGVIVGVSGGIDSAVVSTLAQKAFPNNSLGVIMPITKMSDYEDAKLVTKTNDIKTLEVDLSKPFSNFKDELGLKNNLAAANIKPRLRMTTLYALAQENNYLVLGTDNAAEWVLGYFTKFGDGGADALPLIHLTKGEVRLMAKSLGVDNKIIEKPPTAALWDGQTDEDELGFSYDFVDKYIKGQEVPSDIKEKIEIQNKRTQHKREAAICPQHPEKL